MSLLYYASLLLFFLLTSGPHPAQSSAIYYDQYEVYDEDGHSASFSNHNDGGLVVQYDVSMEQGEPYYDHNGPPVQPALIKYNSYLTKTQSGSHPDQFVEVDIEEEKEEATTKKGPTDKATAGSDRGSELQLVSEGHDASDNEVEDYPPNLLAYLGYSKEQYACPNGYVLDVYGYCREVFQEESRDWRWWRDIRQFVISHYNSGYQLPA